MATLKYNAWDGVLASKAGETASLYVNNVDDRPVLNTSATHALTPVSIDDPNQAGDLVSSLLGSSVFDADVGASLGIAIVKAVIVGGTWQVMTDGVDWNDLGNVSSSAPQLLRGTDRVRFLPSSGFSGIVSIKFKVWDSSSIDPNSTLAFSTSTDLATLAVNRAPVVNL